MLQRTRTVLERVNLPGPPTFQSEDSEGPFVTLTDELFLDMESPTVITVTIEPGDRLNEGELK